MAWFWKSTGSTSTSPALTQEERAKLQRKCKAFVAGLQGCRKANLGPDQEETCKNLEMRLITCYACDVCKTEADEHRKCYTKLYKNGTYNGKNNCLAAEASMTTCLKQLALHPV